MMDERLAYYMQLPYRMVVYREDGYWVAEFPDLPGLGAAGDTWEELGRKIEDAKQAYFETLLERGRDIPEPTSAVA